MENAVEDAVVKKWAAEEVEGGKKDGQAAGGAGAGLGRKRRRIAGRPASEVEVVEMGEVLEIEDGDGEETEGGGDDVFRLPTIGARAGAASTSKIKAARNAQRPK